MSTLDRETMTKPNALNDANADYGHESLNNVIYDVITKELCGFKVKC